MPARRAETPAVVPAARDRAARAPEDGTEQRPPDPRIKSSTGGSLPNPLRSARQIARKVAQRGRALWRTGIVRRATRTRRWVNRKNARIAIATVVCAGLGTAVVLELERAAEIAGYAFAILAALLGLGVVRDVLKVGELDLDLAAAVAAFGSLALFQLL